MTDDELDGLIEGLGVVGEVPAAPRPDFAGEEEAEADDLGPEDVDALIAGLAAAGPVPAAPPIPRSRPSRRMWWGGAALAAAALLAVGITQQDRTPRVTARGHVEDAVDLVLEVSVDRGKGVQRLGKGESISPVDTLYFRVGATPAAPVLLWVEDGGHRQTIFEVDAGPELQMVATDAGLVGYRPDALGRLVVGLRSGDTETALEVMVFD